MSVSISRRMEHGGLHCKKRCTNRSTGTCSPLCRTSESRSATHRDRVALPGPHKGHGMELLTEPEQTLEPGVKGHSLEKIIAPFR